MESLVLAHIGIEAHHHTRAVIHTIKLAPQEKALALK
jgi:hypothetical protein